MSGRIHTPDDDPAASSDDPVGGAEELSAAEAAEIQRQTELEVESFEGGIQG